MMNGSTATLITRFPFLIIFFLLGLLAPNMLKKDVYFGSFIPEHLKNIPELKEVGKLYRKIYLTICGPYVILFTIFIYYYQDEKSYIRGLLLFSAIWIIIYFYTHSKVQKIIENSLKNKVKGAKKNIVYKKTYTPSISNNNIISTPLWFVIPIFLVVLGMVLSFKHFDSIPENIILLWNFNEKAILTVHKSTDVILIYPIIQLLVTLLCFYFYKMAGSIMNMPKENKIYLTRFICILNIYFVLLTSMSFYKSINILNTSPRIVPSSYVFSLVFVPLSIFYVLIKTKNNN